MSKWTNLLICAHLALLSSADINYFEENQSSLSQYNTGNEVRVKRQYPDSTLADRASSSSDMNNGENQQAQNKTEEQISVSYYTYDITPQYYRPPPPPPPPPPYDWGGYYRHHRPPPPPPPPPYDGRYPRHPGDHPPPPPPDYSYDHRPPPHHHDPWHRPPPHDHGPPPPPPHRDHRSWPPPPHDHGPPPYGHRPPPYGHGPPPPHPYGRGPPPHGHGPPPPPPYGHGPPRHHHGPPPPPPYGHGPPHNHSPPPYNRGPPPSHYGQDRPRFNDEPSLPPQQGDGPPQGQRIAPEQTSNPIQSPINKESAQSSIDNQSTNLHNDQQVQSNDSLIKNLKLLFGDDFNNTFLKNRQATQSENNDENSTTLRDDPTYIPGSGEALSGLGPKLQISTSSDVTPPPLPHLFQVVPVTPEN